MDRATLPVELQKIFKSRMRQRIVAAYDQFRATGKAAHFIAAIRSFMYSKAYRTELEFSNFGSHDTADDAAQEATLKAWRYFPTFKGSTGEEFYSWLNKIAFRQRTEHFSSVLKHKKTKVSFTKPTFDEYGAADGVEENPEIYNAPSSGMGFHVRIPDSVQGIDRRICQLIRAGKNYVEIGRRLEMSEAAVTARMQRLRKKLAAAKQTATRGA